MNEQAGTVGGEQPAGRDQALSLIQNRIAQFIWTCDPALLTGPDASRMISATRDLVHLPLTDPAEMTLLSSAGVLAWLRYLVLPAGIDRPALGVAAGLFEPVHAQDPARTIEHLRPLCAAMHQPGADLSQLLLRWCGEHDAVKDGLLAWTMATVAGNDRMRAAGLSRLAEQLAATPAGPRRLNVVIAAFHTAIEAGSADDPDQAARLSNLAGSLEDRYDQTGNPVDLDEAADALRRAVGLSDPHRGASHLSNLSGALQRRYMHNGDQRDLDEALAIARQAVTASPGTASFRHNLASALGLQYQASGQPADLDAMIAEEREALHHDPSAGRERAAKLSELGVGLRASYDLTGRVAELDESIKVHREAIEETPPTDPAGLAIRLNALGTALTARYGRFGQMADLTTSIEVYEQALAAAPDGFPHISLLLSNAGGAYRARYERDRDPGDLTEAADRIGAAYARSRADDPQVYMYGINLGAVVLLRYRASKDPAHLDQAITVLQIIVDDREPGAGPRMLAAGLATLGTALADRYNLTSADADAAAAQRACQQAIALTPDDDIRHDAYCASLASIMSSQAIRTGDEADRAAALAALQDAAASPVVPTSTRIVSAQVAASLCADAGQWKQAAELLGPAVKLLPLTAPRELARTDQEHWLGRFTDLAADAAACALEAGAPEDALAALEFGRGIMLARAFRLRDVDSALRDATPTLASQFERIRAELDTADPLPHLSNDTPDGPLHAFDRNEARFARRRQLIAELDQLTEQIRGLPGLAGFLAPPSAAELASAAAEGPVVFVNVSRYRSDALILTAGGLRPPVRLPRLDPGSAAEKAATLLAAVTGPDSFTGSAPSLREMAAQQERDQQTISQILFWLWETTTGPVLAALGHTQDLALGETKPRVWWCPTGVLSYLPLHAAAGPAGSALDRVVSSYTPTGYALLEARKRQGRTDGADGDGRGLTVVAMPHTDGAPDLPGAGQEARLLAERFPAAEILGTWPGAAAPATRASVLAALRDRAFAHFACHGQCDMAEPANSLLQVSDHATDPLTTADVAQLDLGHARFAYLSACETAQTSPTLTNEAQHLVAAFLLAGYPQVIGTLWRIDDSAAFSMVQGVYDQIAPPGQALNPALAAQALHAAAVDLRERYPDTPTYWAAHIHAGA
jgi:tetratricopeptide (TPR) repeat protein